MRSDNDTMILNIDFLSICSLICLSLFQACYAKTLSKENIPLAK